MKTKNQRVKIKIQTTLEVEYDPVKLSLEEAACGLTGNASFGAAQAVGWLAGVYRTTATSKVMEDGA